MLAHVGQRTSSRNHAAHIRARAHPLTSGACTHGAHATVLSPHGDGHRARAHLCSGFRATREPRFTTLAYLVDAAALRVAFRSLSRL